MFILWHLSDTFRFVSKKLSPAPLSSPSHHSRLRSALSSHHSRHPLSSLQSPAHKLSSPGIQSRHHRLPGSPPGTGLLLTLPVVGLLSLLPRPLSLLSSPLCLRWRQVSSSLSPPSSCCGPSSSASSPAAWPAAVTPETRHLQTFAWTCHLVRWLSCKQSSRGSSTMLALETPSTARHSPLMGLLPWCQQVRCLMRSLIVMKNLKDGMMRACSEWNTCPPLTRAGGSSRLTSSRTPRLTTVTRLPHCPPTPGAQLCVRSACKYSSIVWLSSPWVWSSWQILGKEVSVLINFSKIKIFWPHCERTQWG